MPTSTYIPGSVGPGNLPPTTTANIASTPATPAPQSASGAATPSYTSSQPASINAQTLGQPTITSSQLPQQPAYAPSPIPDLSTITAQGAAPTQSQGQYDSITNQIGQLTGQLSGQTDFANNLQTQYNVPQLTSTANDLTANISNIQQQRDSVQQQLKNQYGNDASKGYLSFEQQSVDSDLAAKQSAYAGTLAAINGQLSTAKSYIDTAVTNKYTPIENQIDALNKQAALVKGTLDNEQSKQLAVMQAQLTDRSNQIAANKAITTSMLEKIATAAANPGNPAPAYVVSQAQAAALSDNPASALDIISSYLQDPLAAKAEIADIQSKTASAASSYADANLKNKQASVYDNPAPTTDASTGSTFTYNGAALNSATAPSGALISYATQNGTFDPSMLPKSATSPVRADIITILRSNPNFDFIANKSNIAAAATAARTQAKASTNLQMNLGTINDHISSVQTAINAIPQTDINGINTLEYQASRFTNPTQYAAFTKFYSEAAALREEVAKALGGGAATDSSRAAASAIIPEDITPAGFQSVVSAPGGIQSLIQAKLDNANKPVNVPNYTNSSSGGMTVMTGPDGNQYNVPNANVAAFKAAGGH